MNKKTEEHLKNLLNSMKQKLTEGVEKCLQESKDEVKGGVPDINDDATRTYNRQVLLNLSEKERGQLESVDEAFQKIKDGRYGICEECDEHIPIKRLELVPYAKLCVECKSKREINP